MSENICRQLSQVEEDGDKTEEEEEDVIDNRTPSHPVDSQRVAPPETLSSDRDRFRMVKKMVSKA